MTHLNAELTATRASLTQALESRDKLAGEREKLADQYRNYSKVKQNYFNFSYIKFPAKKGGNSRNNTKMEKKGVSFTCSRKFYIHTQRILQTVGITEGVQVI